MTRGRWLRITLVGGLAALILGRWLTVAATNRTWAESLGVAADHADIARLQTTLFLWALVIAAAWTAGNLALLYGSIGSVHVPRRLANIEIVEALPRRFLLMAFVAIGAALSLAMSYPAGTWWKVRALAGQPERLGVIEPILGRDIAYYLFQLPWHRTLHGFALTLGVVVFGVVTIGYVAIGALAAQDRGIRVSDRARRHLGVVLALVALVLAWGYRLEAPEGVAGLHGVPFDTVLVDVRLPVARLLSALALVAALASVVWIRYDRFSIVAFGWITLATFSVVGHYLVPPVAAGSRAPAERVPAEFVDARSRFEAVAYGGVLGADSLRRTGQDGRPPARAPVWHEFAVRVVAHRLLGLDTSAAGIDLGLGVRGRHPEWVIVPREGVGAAAPVLALRADTTDDTGGMVSSRPPSLLGAAGPRAPVRFGPGRGGVVVDSGPGVIGVEPGGPLDRLALAWRLQRWSLLTAPARTRVMATRDVGERLVRYAPFADFDAAAPALVDGRLVWLADGYLSAEAFPLSRPVAWRGRAVGYLRPGLVGLVDAHTGATRVFLRPGPDPLSDAWRTLAPGIVEDFGAAPAGLAAQLAYPAALFDAWISLLGEHPRTSRLPFFPRSRSDLDDAPAGTVLTVDRAPGDPTVSLRRRAVVGTPEGSVLLEGSVQDGSPVLRSHGLGPDGSGTTLAVQRLAEAGAPGIGSAVSLQWTGRGWAAVQSVYSTHASDSLPYVTEIAADLGHGVGRGRTLDDALARAAELSEPGLDVRTDWAAARLWFERLDQARRRGDWVSFGLSYEALRRLFGVPPDSVP